MSNDTLVVPTTPDKSDQSIPYILDKPTTAAVMRYVYKLSTKQLVSVNRVTEIPTTDDMVNIVNNIAEQEAQPEGI
jgi:hypothetical protein